MFESKTDPITHVYEQLRVIRILQSLRPHFLLSLCDRKFARRPQKLIVSVVSANPKKKGSFVHVPAENG